MNLSRRLLFGVGSVAVWCIAGCVSPPKQEPMAFTDQALLATDGMKTNASSDTITRFETFSGDISSNNIASNTGNVYAAGVYFRDPFKEIHGEQPFEAYLLRGSDSTAQFSMEWKDVAESHGDYYFRWVMTLKLKREGKNKPPTLTPGISLVRFGPDGKVIFQQDYYDAGQFLYEKLPIIGGEIRFIKKRM